MTVMVIRGDLTAVELREAACISTDANASRRMLAIALVLEGHDRKSAAMICDMERQTLRDWIHRYNAEGLDGLSSRVSSGPKPLLTVAQKKQFAQWVKDGPDPEVDGVVRWRCADLRQKIEEEFKVVMHERTVGKHLANLGFRRLSVRPQHPQADEEAQEKYKWRRDRDSNPG